MQVTMKTSLYSSALALLFISACRAAPAQQTLNDGSSLKYGTVYGGQLSYDSSGMQSLVSQQSSH